jgi:hypothetical protein
MKHLIVQLSPISLNNDKISDMFIDSKTLLSWTKKVTWTFLNQTPTFLMYLN